LVVEYTVVKSQTATSRETGGGKLTGVTAIDFYPGLIVVQTNKSGGMVFWAERTLEFAWHPARRE